MRPFAARFDGDALATIGIDLDEVLRHVERAFGPDAVEQTCADGRRWRRPKRAPQFAVLEAGDLPPDPTQALVGLASVPDSLAARILAAHELGLAAVRTELADALP